MTMLNWRWRKSLTVEIGYSCLSIATFFSRPSCSAIDSSSEVFLLPVLHDY